MAPDDEPALPFSPPLEPVDVTGDATLPARIARLASEQPYGVLCTQGGRQPYGSLVAFAFASDLRAVVFATPVATRKYRLLTECDQVALVIDNRPQHLDDMMQVEALTVTGRASEIERGPERDRHARLLIGRHPHLAAFVESASCALFRIDVARGFHVTRFQEVGQWVPPGAR